MARKKKDTKDAREEPIGYDRREEQLHVAQLVRSDLNPRRIRTAANEAKVVELGESIRRLGVLDRLLVRERTDGTFEMLAGESRWRGAQIAMVDVPDRAWLPCAVYAADMPDEVAFEIAVASNDHRDDPHPLDQCDAFVQMRDVYGRAVQQIAAKVGRTPQYVYSRMRLEHLTQAGRSALIAERISIGVAEVLARIASSTAQDRALDELLKRWPDGPPIAQARDVAKRRLMVIADAPFNTHDAELVPTAGACTTCPKRSDTEAQQELFGALLGDTDEDRETRCTDLDCWEGKRDAAWEREAERLRAEGKRVATPEEEREIRRVEYGGLAQGYARLDDWGVGDDTWRAALGDRIGELAITVIRDEHGKAIEVAKRDDMLAIVRGRDRNGEGTAEKDPTADHGFEMKVRREARQRAVGAAVAAIEARGPSTTIAFWRALARMVVTTDTGIDGLEDCVERRGIVIDEESDEPTLTAIMRTIDEMRDVELVGLMVELLLSESLQRSGFGPTGDARGDLLRELGVDHAKHERAARRALEAERKRQRDAVGKSPTKPKSRKDLDAEEADGKREHFEDLHG